MKLFNKVGLSLLGLSLVLVSASQVFAQDEQALVAAQGYDVVSYQTEKAPLKGEGFYVAQHKGALYEFANETNKALFVANPDKYVPAYNGYCAYGVAIGKKFVGNPQVYKVVDGKLYLNLSMGIRDTWSQDVPGYIEKAEQNWSKIERKPAQDL
ncbi:MAG: YHS domain protein [Cyanobacteria bacterium]|nr:YHS domain protein [Cyanobacteriota bacterium]